MMLSTDFNLFLMLKKFNFATHSGNGYRQSFLNMAVRNVRDVFLQIFAYFQLLIFCICICISSRNLNVDAMLMPKIEVSTAFLKS